MKTIDEIHRLNLVVLVQEFGGVGKLADTIERSSSQVSQWINASANSATGKPRGLGPSSCRLIERACGKPKGWMDIEHSEPAHQPEQPAIAYEYQWISPREAKLLTNYRTVSDKGQVMIDDLADGLEKVIVTPATGSKGN